MAFVAFHHTFHLKTFFPCLSQSLATCLFYLLHPDYLHSPVICGCPLGVPSASPFFLYECIDHIHAKSAWMLLDLPASEFISV